MTFVIVGCVVALAGLAGAAETLTGTPAVPGASAVPSAPVTLLPARAETFYTDRATFQAANPGLALEDFETPLHPPGSAVLLGCPHPANNAGGSAGCYNAGDLLPGFSMTSPGSTTAAEAVVTLDGAAGYGSPAGIVLGSNTFTASTRVDFDPPVAAVGFLVVTLVGGNPVDVTLYDAGGATINGQVGVPGGAAGSFWGVYSDTTPIAAVVVNDPTGADVELLDDMEFGDPVPVELQSLSVE